MADTDYTLVNRAYWDGMAHEWVAGGERAWNSTEPRWGIWQIPQSRLPLLPTDMTGMDAIELGCGTGYVAAWMARRGANVVAIDNSEQQLATARRLQQQHSLQFPLIHGNAEQVPLPNASFDFAISEYGAAIWCDPYRWIPEAYRLLRPGGQLVFLGNTPWALVCSPQNGSLPITESLERDYFGMHKFNWEGAIDDPGGVEFNLPLSTWIKLFKDTGFIIEDYLEPRPEGNSQEVRYYVSESWAHRFPAEQVWKLRKPS